MAAKKAKPKAKAPNKKAVKKPAARKKAKAAAKKPIAKKVAKKAVAKRAVAKKAVAKKAVAKKAVAKKAVAKKPVAKKAVAKKRHDRAGHLDPQYAAGLRSQSGKPEKDNREAWIKGSHSDDDLAEGLAEEVIGKATTGEDEGEEMAQQIVDEERGGPFVVTTGGTEFADGVDESNPADAEREPFPTT